MNTIGPVVNLYLNIFTLDSQQIIKNWILAITFIHSHDLHCAAHSRRYFLSWFPVALAEKSLERWCKLRVAIFLLLVHRFISPHSSYCIVNSPVASALQVLRRKLFHDLKDGRLEDSLLVLEEGAVYRHLVGQHWIPHTCTRNSFLETRNYLNTLLNVVFL